MQVRPGGRWRYTMHHPDGRDYPNLITYLEIEEPARIVYEHGGGEPGLATVVRAPFSETWPLSMHSTVIFADHAGIGSGTVLTLRASVPDATPAERETFKQGYGSMRAGWGGTFEQLESYLTRLDA